jgi:hypothetical protein
MGKEILNTIKEISFCIMAVILVSATFKFNIEIALGKKKLNIKNTFKK